jgi:hypothetical protein
VKRERDSYREYAGEEQSHIGRVMHVHVFQGMAGHPAPDNDSLGEVEETIEGFAEAATPHTERERQRRDIPGRISHERPQVRGRGSERTACLHVKGVPGLVSFLRRKRIGRPVRRVDGGDLHVESLPSQGSYLAQQVGMVNRRDLGYEIRQPGGARHVGVLSADPARSHSHIVYPKRPKLAVFPRLTSPHT